MLVRFKEFAPVKLVQVAGFQELFSAIINRGLLTSMAAEILQRILKQVSIEPQFSRTGSDTSDELPPALTVDQAYNEMSRVLRIAGEVKPQSLQHHLLLALLIYIFNFHNQPQLLPPSTFSSSSSSILGPCKIRHPYLEILSKVASELSQPRNPSRPAVVTEREVTLWTMVAIASASSFSPWRLEIPFMGHLIEWMEDDDDDDDDDDDFTPCQNISHLESCHSELQ